MEQRQQASTSRVDISSVDMTGQSVDSSMMDVRDLLQNVQQFSTEESHGRVEDTVDYTVVHFGTNCTLRGRQVCPMLQINFTYSCYRAVY